MLLVEDYVSVDSISNFEFGFVLSKEESKQVIKVVVADHHGYKIRILEEVYNIGSAFDVVSEYIQRGFYIEGLSFMGNPDYTLPPLRVNGINR